MLCVYIYTYVQYHVYIYIYKVFTNMISYLKYWGSRTYRNISLEIYPLGLAGKALGVSNVSMMGNTSYRERTEFSL